MKSRESVASCCEGKTCASSRHSRKPAFQLQEGRVNPAQTLQEFEQRFSKKKLERPKAGLSRGIPTLGCAAFSNVFFARSGAGRPVRGARLSKRNPDFGVCGVFQRFFRTFWSWDTNATHNILHLFLCSAQGKARPEPFERSKTVLAPQTKAQTEDKEGQEVSSNVTITVSSSAQRLSRESPTACKPAE
jgi:hypothetical protein